MLKYKFHRTATFLLMGLLLLQLTGLTCLTDKVPDSNQVLTYSQDHNASDMDSLTYTDQDACPCHLLFSTAVLVSHEAVERVNSVSPVTMLFTPPLFTFDLFRPPLDI